MKPKLQHQEAMRYSFLAKEAFEQGRDPDAQEYYARAAALESELAEFYFDKPELEPTRGTIVRSAVFLNLKAGRIGEAQKLIYRGMLNLQNDAIREQLQEALEMSMAMKHAAAGDTGGNFEYLRVLREKSIYYTLENASPKFGSAITFEMIRDFADDYLKSLKAYGASAFRRIAAGIKGLSGDIEGAAEEFEKLVNPLITGSAFGSFKFSIANDFLPRIGEPGEVVRLKTTVLRDYHDRIFTNPLDDDNIRLLKAEYKPDEINRIFRPIAKIKSADSPYKVAYYDSDDFSKIYIPRLGKLQKRKLLPPKAPSREDIGVLENAIFHARDREGGKKTRSLIQREQLKSYEFEIPTRQIEMKDRPSLPLNEEIVISVAFDSGKGFHFTFEELEVEHTDIEYGKGLSVFYGKLYNVLGAMANPNRNQAFDPGQIALAGRLINDPGQLGT